MRRPPRSFSHLLGMIDCQAHGAKIMKKVLSITGCGFLVFAAGWMMQAGTNGIDARSVISGKSAFVDAKDLKPGTYRKITAADLPEPTKGTPNFGRPAPRPEGAAPQAPAGFKVEL